MPYLLQRILRFIILILILATTAALLITSANKIYEVATANQAYQKRQVQSFASTPEQNLFLMSNNQKPDQAILIVARDKGYLLKLSCSHYLDSLCTDQYNFFSTRQIITAQVEQIGHHHYFKHLRWYDQKQQQEHTLNWTDAQISNLYQTDIQNLYDIIVIISLFSLAALYCSYRLLRNVRSFLRIGS